MDEKVLRIAVVSDLHFVEESKSSGHMSWLAFNESKKFHSGLWAALLKKISSDNLEADILLCPGDITTHANKSGLEVAWEKLQELSDCLKCELLAVATGNHDVESRGIDQLDNPIRELDSYTDLIENLKILSPPYPLKINSESCTKTTHERRVFYFGSDYLLYDENDDYRLVIFNSCARHNQLKKEYERGRIANSTLNWLEEHLKSIHDKKNLKPSIFLCHHHPIPHSIKGLSQYDTMYGGESLINMLSKYGNWIIIHGHKHHATLKYTYGGSKRIPVFAAGTLSAHKDSLGEEFNNQIYIIELNIEKCRGPLKGKVNAWSWKGNHWAISKSQLDGIYTGVGFGFTGTLEKIAQDIQNIVPPVGSIDWDKVVSKIPDLSYLMPMDFEHLKEELEVLNIDMDINSDSELVSLSRIGGLS
ncbi:metallophosphoesterase family protein [Litoribacillus peritrichatus]|uniref:Calcineurin-like phosphoesterase domain-containing protein n=1 Tax=Litoribacillus peritrichatus TaxID=718191 RepID=A0ABP7MIB4_9GAMM